jgi:hypothetical protein
MGDEPREHVLKTWPCYFKDVYAEIKKFELRKDDRNFRVGDLLILREWSPQTERFTGRECIRRVVYKVSEGPLPIKGLLEEYCILGIERV